MNTITFNKRFNVFLILLLCFTVFGCNWSSSPDEDEKEFTLKFNPSPAVIEGAGESVDVDVIVKNAPGLITARVTISFNPSFLGVESIAAEGPGFMFSVAGAEIDVLESDYDNEIGRIVIGIGALKPDFRGASGNGKLATITFKGLKTGFSYLSIVDYDQADTFLASYSGSNSAGWKNTPPSPEIGTIRIVE